MRIIVPSRWTSAPATRALVMEGHEVIEVVLDDLHLGYSRLVRDEWNAGLGGFIVVEDDVVPWPGALREFEQCEHDWCAFEVPRGVVSYEPRSGFAIGLACMRFSDALVGRHHADWLDVRSDEVEFQVRLMLEAEEELHLHYPACAHLKPMMTAQRRVTLAFPG
jgi:hypothetical protein